MSVITSTHIRNGTAFIKSWGDVGIPHNLKNYLSLKKSNACRGFDVGEVRNCGMLTVAYV